MYQKDKRIEFHVPGLIFTRPESDYCSICGTLYEFHKCEGYDPTKEVYGEDLQHVIDTNFNFLLEKYKTYIQNNISKKDWENLHRDVSVMIHERFGNPLTRHERKNTFTDTN